MIFKLKDKVRVRSELLVQCKNWLADHEDEPGVDRFPREFIGFNFPIQMYRDIVAAKGVGTVNYIGEQSDIPTRKYDVRFKYSKSFSTTWTLPGFTLLSDKKTINTLGNFPLKKEKRRRK